MIALDTNLFIYVLDGSKEFGPQASRVMREAQGKGTASELVYLELLGNSIFQDKLKKRAAMAFLDEQSLLFSPLDKATLLKAAELRANLTPKLGLGDALHLASALQAGADTFITNDHNLHKLHIPNLAIIGL